mgnify:CR=1 FL=1
MPDPVQIKITSTADTAAIKAATDAVKELQSASLATAPPDLEAGERAAAAAARAARNAALDAADAQRETAAAAAAEAAQLAKNAAAKKAAADAAKHLAGQKRDLLQAFRSLGSQIPGATSATMLLRAALSPLGAVVIGTGIAIGVLIKWLSDLDAKVRASESGRLFFEGMEKMREATGHAIERQADLQRSLAGTYSALDKAAEGFKALNDQIDRGKSTQEKLIDAQKAQAMLAIDRDEQLGEGRGGISKATAIKERARVEAAAARDKIAAEEIAEQGKIALAISEQAFKKQALAKATKDHLEVSAKLSTLERTQAGTQRTPAEIQKDLENVRGIATTLTGPGGLTAINTKSLFGGQSAQEMIRDSGRTPDFSPGNAMEEQLRTVLEEKEARLLKELEITRSTEAARKASLAQLAADEKRLAAEMIELTGAVKRAADSIPTSIARLNQTVALNRSFSAIGDATGQTKAGNALLADHDARMLAEAKASGLGKGGNVSPSVPDGLGAIPPQLQEIIDRNAMLITQAWFDALMWQTKKLTNRIDTTAR